jgi:manganese/iron transport system permease protein
MMLLWHAAALLSGSSVGLLGVYAVGLRMPFLGIGMAHAAMAGAIIGHVSGLPPTLFALAFALAAGAGMAWLATTHARTDLGTMTSILLSFTMGCAFLAMGFNKGEMSPVLTMMWGSMLFVGTQDVIVMAGLALALFAFLAFCSRSMDALLFSRAIARVCGLPERKLLMVFMVLAGLLITVNLQIVGGLLMYSLLTNPAAAAFELGGSMRAVRWAALGFGIASTLGGFWFSYLCDLPTGACIVLVSTLLYCGAVVLARRRAKPGQMGSV